MIKTLLKYLLLVSFLPVLIIYLIICFTVPIIVVKRTKKKYPEREIFIKKDLIHADYVFYSRVWSDYFPTDKKYTIIGWGDKSIFLETDSWRNLKFENFLKAFFGLNKTVLRVLHVDELPKNARRITLSNHQLNKISQHILFSFDLIPIQKQPNHYQVGDYYESNLNYNCMNTCNQWVNKGLYKADLTGRIWSPISFWI